MFRRIRYDVCLLRFGEAESLLLYRGRYCIKHDNNDVSLDRSISADHVHVEQRCKDVMNIEKARPKGIVQKVHTRQLELVSRSRVCCPV